MCILFLICNKVVFYESKAVLCVFFLTPQVYRAYIFVTRISPCNLLYVDNRRIVDDLYCKRLNNDFETLAGVELNILSCQL